MFKENVSESISNVFNAMRDCQNIIELGKINISTIRRTMGASVLAEKNIINIKECFSVSLNIFFEKLKNCREKGLLKSEHIKIIIDFLEQCANFGKLINESMGRDIFFKSNYSPRFLTAHSQTLMNMCKENTLEVFLNPSKAQQAQEELQKVETVQHNVNYKLFVTSTLLFAAVIFAPEYFQTIMFTLFLISVYKEAYDTLPGLFFDTDQDDDPSNDQLRM